jgi:hypothetical protein
MQATIQLIDTTRSQWLINMSDLTNGNSYQNAFTYNSSKLSAEWILERPTVNNVLASLANFDKVTFTNCEATIDNATETINSIPALQIVMYTETARPENAQRLVDVAPVIQNGTEFAVIYLKPQ